MKLIYKNGAIEVYFADGEYWVYGIMADPRVVPSIEMARALVAKYL